MSVLLMSFFLLVIVLIISFGLNKQKVLRPGKFSKYGNGTKAKWILGIYVLILLVSVIVLYLIPNKGFLNQNEDYQSKITQAQTALLDIYTAAKEHRLDKTKGINIGEKWEFPFDKKQIDVTSFMQNSNIQIIAEKKSNNDNKIEVIEYTTKSIVYGIDITNKIKSPQFELIGNALMISKPQNLSIKLTSFNKEFIINQFTKGGNKQLDYFSNIIWGQRILYLRIPKDVQVLKNNLNIQFIEGE